MKPTFFASYSYKRFTQSIKRKTTLLPNVVLQRNVRDPRYAVYVAEIRKRLTYVALSLLFAWVCAYTQRVGLMYSITLSLQRSLPQISQETQTANPFGESGYSNNNITPLFSRQTTFGVPLGCSQSEGGDVWKKVENGDLLLSDKSGESKLFAFWQGDDLFSSSFSAINQDGAVRLIFTDVQEAFYTLLSVSLFWCIWACFPVLIYHLLCFFQPGFHAGQSRRVCTFVLKRIVWGYLVLWLVDFFLIPRLLSFFYSFQIERSSLCLHAETKVISYVSLYVFVYSSTVALLLLTGLWGFYRRQQILEWLSTPGVYQTLLGNGTCNPTAFRKNLFVLRSTQFLPKNYLTNQLNPLGDRYREQRGRVWWGCLLVAAFISPPDISSQFACALLLIVWSEIGIWLAYTSCSRFLARSEGRLSKKQASNN